MKHKWANEIKAFVDGKEVEYRIKILYEPPNEDEMFYVQEWTNWSKLHNLKAFENDNSYQFRIKKGS